MKALSPFKSTHLAFSAPCCGSSVSIFAHDSLLFSSLSAWIAGPTRSGAGGSQIAILIRSRLPLADHLEHQICCLKAAKGLDVLAMAPIEAGFLALAEYDGLCLD